MNRYTAYYDRAGAFFVSEMLLAQNDEEASCRAQSRADIYLNWPENVTLRRLDRHVTVYEARE